MDYLFFDIECSDGKHMCSFGYVLTDDKFNVLEKRDILINPEAIFHTGAWSKHKRELKPKDKGIELAYPQQTFLEAPTFPELYETIVGLLTRANTTVMGFSNDNDARFISSACYRYKMPCPDYVFYDMQRVYRELRKLKDQTALEKVIEDLGVDISEYVPHRSDDDSEVTMLVARGLCRELGITPEELIARYPASEGSMVNGIVKYKQNKNAVCGSAYGGGNTMRKNFARFARYARRVKINRGATSPFAGRRVSVSTVYEDKHFGEMLAIVARLAELGARYVTRVTECDLYIEYKKQDKRCRRYRFLREAEEKGKDIEIMGFADFINGIGFTEETLTDESEKIRLKLGSLGNLD